MALTKVNNDLLTLDAAQPSITSTGTLTNFTSTGIDDNATSTAITIDASENVGINTVSPTHLLQISGGSTDGRMSFTNNARGNGQSDGMWVGVDSTQSYLLSRGAFPLTFYTNATERLKIDASGRVTMPYQPSFQTAGTNYTQAASGTYSKIIPASEMHDTGNNFSSGTFTAPIAGTYEFAFWGLMYPFTTSQNSTIFYRKNNSNISQGIQGGGAANSHQQMSGSIILVLALGDYVDLWLVTSGGKAYSGQWHMSGKLIG